MFECDIADCSSHLCCSTGSQLSHTHAQLLLVRHYAGHAMDQLQYLDKSGHIQTDTLLTWGLATCHNVSQSDLGLVGNEVEVKMFAVTGWNLQQMSGQPTRVAHPVDARQQLTVVRVNEFEHSRRSMSVVALDESSGELHVFCKVGGLFHKACIT